MPPLLGDPAADAYLSRLERRLRSVLADRLVGAWLINSGAQGDYVPGRSDLDVTVGVADRLAADARLELADALGHAALRCPAPRLELVVYRRSVLRRPGARPEWELNLNTGSAITDHVGTDPRAEPAHWFVLDLAMAREAFVTLAGPPLADLLGPIPQPVVVDALRASASWHETNDADAPNRVLNACRAWRWLEERRWSSKTDAAEWAIAAGADAGLVARALARRRGETSEPLPPDRVAAIAREVESRLAAQPSVRRPAR